MASYELNNVKDAEPNVATIVTDYGNDDGIANANLTRRHGGDSEKMESHRSQDEAAIARFGKKQQLKVRCLSKTSCVLCNTKLTVLLQRRFKSLSSVGLTCGLMLTWEVILL
jgi:choline transport protein